MSSFDPAAVRKAIEEFTPRRPQKFQDLLPAKDVIVELRQKRASYRSIAELLTQHCLPTSMTAIAQFCHQVLGENVRHANGRGADGRLFPCPRMEKEQPLNHRRPVTLAHRLNLSRSGDSTTGRARGTDYSVMCGRSDQPRGRQTRTGLFVDRR